MTTRDNIESENAASTLEGAQISALSKSNLLSLSQADKQKQSSSLSEKIEDENIKSTAIGISAVLGFSMLAGAARAGFKPVRALDIITASSGKSAHRDILPTVHIVKASEASEPASKATHTKAAIERKLSNSEEQNVKTLVAEQTDYKVLGRMERGTRGAWLLEVDDGSKAIFKLVSRDNLSAQVQHSAEAATKVNSLASPTPTYKQIGFTKPFGTWYVQGLLPGIPAPAPSDRLIFQMMRMNEKQAGNAIHNSTNWSDQVMNNLYHDSYGWQKRIASSSPEGKALVQNIRHVADKNRSLNLAQGDIVHGDFQHYNALVSKNDRLTGYVDWEGAGRGDRGIDLSRLLYDAYVSEAEIGYKATSSTLSLLSRQIQEISGKNAYENFMSYWVLQVSNYGVGKGPKDAGMFMGVGRRILNELKQEQPPAWLNRKYKPGSAGF